MKKVTSSKLFILIRFKLSKTFSNLHEIRELYVRNVFFKFMRHSFYFRIQGNTK